jgi:hypothetical protein
VRKDRAHGQGIGKESDDAHRGATQGTHERKNFVDAGAQQRPGIAGGATMGRFGSGLRVGCGRRDRRGQREGGDRSAQGRVGGEERGDKRTEQPDATANRRLTRATGPATLRLARLKWLYVYSSVHSSTGQARNLPAAVPMFLL